jgi:hypothetical protein
VDVAAGHGIADAEQLESAIPIVDRALRAAGEQRIEVDLAEVGGGRLQLEIEVVRGQRAVLDHHLNDHPLLESPRVFVVEDGGEPVALAADRTQPAVPG